MRKRKLLHSYIYSIFLVLLTYSRRRVKAEQKQNIYKYINYILACKL